MKTLTYSTVPGSDGAIAVLKVGDYLYTAGGDTICVYDVSKADSPKFIRRCSGFGNCRQLAASNGRLYLTARNFGLWIISLEDPASPKKLCHFDSVEQATGIAVSGDFVFITHRIFGIEVVDCSDPRHPRHCSMIRTDEAQSAEFHNGLLYVGDWGAAKLTVIDVSNPYKPKICSKSKIGGNGDGIAILGDICCAATGLNRKGSDVVTSFQGDGHGLEVFRLSPDGKPKHLARVNFPRLEVKTNDFWTVRIAGKTAFVADTHNGVFQVDISIPEQPVCVGHIELPPIFRFDSRPSGRIRVSVPDCAGGIAVGNGVLYVAGQKTGLHVTKIAEADVSRAPSLSPYKFLPGQPITEKVPGFQQYALGGQVHRASIDEKHNRLFVACSHAGIKILKMKEPIAQITGEKQLKCSYDVLYRDGKLYSAEGMDGLAIYAAEGNELREIGRFKSRRMIFQYVHLSANRNFAICGCRDGILRFFDVTDPTHIFMAWSHLHGGQLYGDIMPECDHNNMMPIIWPYTGISWYDLSAKKPQLVYDDRTDYPGGQCEGITWWNGCYLMSTLKNTFRLLNPADCGKTWTEIPNGCSGVPSINGNIIAFSHRRNGDVQVYRMTESNAELIPERSLTGLAGTPERIVFYQSRMIIPCGYQGLLIENK